MHRCTCSLLEKRFRLFLPLFFFDHSQIVELVRFSFLSLFFSPLRAPPPNQSGTNAIGFPPAKSFSGAMDKFTGKKGVAAGGRVEVAEKRTKTVLRPRTYMEGGYMKLVNEEVEVTDNEEV